MKRLFVVLLITVAGTLFAQSWEMHHGEDGDKYIVGQAAEVRGLGGERPFLVVSQDGDMTIVMMIWPASISEDRLIVSFDGGEARNWYMLSDGQSTAVVDRQMFLESMFRSQYVILGVRTEQGPISARWNLREFRSVYQKEW